MQLEQGEIHLVLRDVREVIRGGDFMTSSFRPKDGLSYLPIVIDTR
ncbi:hypothetical protein ACWGJ0_34360 [Streptomyces massasporeus]